MCPYRNFCRVMQHVCHLDSRFALGGCEFGLSWTLGKASYDIQMNTALALDPCLAVEARGV